MEIAKTQVTLQYSTQQIRGFDGLNKEAIVFNKFARIQFNDGTVAMGTIEILVNDGQNDSGFSSERPVFFIERNDVRDNGDGNVVNNFEVPAGTEI